MNNKNNNINSQVTDIGEETFKKLKELHIPPYPKYYYDTFMDKLSSTDNSVLIDLSKKYSHLFSINEGEDSMNHISFEIAKSSLNEFEKSNTTLKQISTDNYVNIDDIRDEDNIDSKNVLNTFNNFQAGVLNELKNADETINKLKLEIEKLERESHIDPLTKTYNRRVFTKDLNEIIKAIDEQKEDMFLILIDADDFKKVNDSFGHIAGDKTLIFLAKLIKSSLRKGVKVYRYGGEEFIVVINRIALEEAKNSIDRIIKETSKSKLLYKGHTIKLTISAGIAPFVKGDTPESLVDKADKALYEAKANGKNCYKVYN